jgi:hypothetical protein
MKVIALLIVLCLPFAGCSIPRSIAEGGPLATKRVNPAGKVLILGIADGREQGQESAPGSGQGMVAALRKVLTAHGVPLSTTSTSSLPNGVDEARRGGFDYALKCTITLWEDNATAWSGNGDKLTISIELFDANSREAVAAATHRRVATGITFVSGSPDRFMDEVAAGALGKIYGWSQTDNARTQAHVQAANGQSLELKDQLPASDVEIMNTELRRLAKDAMVSGDQKAAKEYLDMIVPTSAQH